MSTPKCCYSAHSHKYTLEMDRETLQIVLGACRMDIERHTIEKNQLDLSNPDDGLYFADLSHIDTILALVLGSFTDEAITPLPY